MSGPPQPPYSDDEDDYEDDDEEVTSSVATSNRLALHFAGIIVTSPKGAKRLN